MVFSNNRKTALTTGIDSIRWGSEAKIAMKKMTSLLGRVSLLSFLGVAGMSIHTVDAQAAVINLTGPGNNLYNTGLATNGSLLGDNQQDPHYTVAFYNTGSTFGSPPATYTVTDYGTPTLTGPAYQAFPLATDPYAPHNSEDWVSNSLASQWITYANTVISEPNTPYDQVTVYQLVLSNIPANDQVTIGGQVAADDNVTIYGNGKQLFSNYSVTDNGAINEDNYNQFNPFSGTFTSGTSNTLDFVVYNNGGYDTGLNAQLTGSYTTAVPEPASFGLMILGCLSLLALGRTKLSNAQN
jgi:hypothetical protein